MWPILIEFWLFSELGRYVAKKEEESVIKYKSADNYVGRPIIICNN